MESVFLPDGMTALSAVIVVITAMLTAGLTAALGLGGGLVLIAVMSATMPIIAVIPVHGFAQLGSNAGRTLIQFRHVVWPIFFWFTAGGIVGVLAGGQLVIAMPENLLKAGVGLFCLISVWGSVLLPTINIPKPGAGSFFATGTIGSFLTLFFGATGPIAAAVIGRANLDRFATTGTHGACMLSQHLMKVITFGVIGFAYGPWVPFIVMLVCAGFVGTWIGSRILIRLPEKSFKIGLQMTITAIAVWLLISAFSSWGNLRSI